MDDGRILALSGNTEFLSCNTKKLIDKFKNYISSNLPLITILCSTGKLADKVKKLQINSQGIYTSIISTLDNNEDLQDIICFSDIIIVYTTALKIAPEHMYEKVKIADGFGKNTYFLVGGWSQIGRSQSVAKSKIDDIYTSYGSSKIAAVYLEDEEKNDGFLCLNEIFNNIVSELLNKFSIIRHEQEEKLYRFIVKAVNDDYSSAENDIVEELVNCNGLIEFVQKKHSSSQVVFKNAGVDLLDVSNNLCERILSSVPKDYKEYVDGDDDIDLEKFLTSVKQKIKTNIDDSFGTNERMEFNDDLKVKIESLKSECIQEMMTILSNVQKMNYLTPELIQELKTSICEEHEFDEFIEKEDQSFNTEIDKIKAEILSLIDNIQIENKDYKRIAFVKDAFQWLDAGVDYIVEKQKNNEEDSEKNDKDHANEIIGKRTQLEKGFDKVQKASLNEIINQVCEESEAILSRKIDDSMGNVNKRMISISVKYIDQYFNSILSVMYKMKQHLESQKSGCKRI